MYPRSVINPASLRKPAGPFLSCAFAGIAAAAAAPHWGYAALLAGIILLSAFLVITRPKVFLLLALSLWTFRGAVGESVILILYPGFSFGMEGFFNGLIVFAGLLYALSRKMPDFSLKPFYLFGALLLLYAFSLFYTDSLSGGIRFLVRIACPFGFYCIVLGETKNAKDIRMLTSAILVSSFFPLAAGLYQLFSGGGFADPVGLTRLNSVFPHPLPFSYYLVMLIFIMLFYTFLSPSQRGRAVFFSAALIAALLLLFTYSRAAWTAGVLAMALFGWLCRRKAKISLAFSAAVLLAALLISPVRERTASIFAWTDGARGGPGHENSVLWRGEARSALIEGIPEAALTGHGAGSSQIPIERRLGEPISPHNDYLLILYESGIFGLFLFLAFIALLAARAVRAANRPAAGLGAESAALCAAAIMIFAVICTVDGFLEQASVSLYYWALFALCEPHAGETS